MGGSVSDRKPNKLNYRRLFNMELWKKLVLFFGIPLVVIWCFFDAIFFKNWDKKEVEK